MKGHMMPLITPLLPTDLGAPTMLTNVVGFSTSETPSLVDDCMQSIFGGQAHVYLT